MTLQVLVTRPVEQAGEWVDALRARGLAAHSLPLLRISSGTDTDAAVAQAWRGLAQRAIVMFVSPNAVDRFFAAAPAGSSWPRGLRAAAPGPGTARALQARGVAAEHIVQPPDDAPTFDSEHLWPALSLEPWAGRSVLIVRGDGGRDWLAERWVAAGAQVQALEAYRRGAPCWSAEEVSRLAAALQRPREHLWLLSSSQAITWLTARVALPPGARALATHPTIARTAREQGFSEVHVTGAGLQSVLSCLKSMG